MVNTKYNKETEVKTFQNLIAANRFTKDFLKPLYLIIVTLLSIFLAEVLVMFILSILPPLSIFTEALIDASLLIFIIFPMLYFLIFKPFLLHVTGQAEVKTKESEEKYRSLVDSTDDSIYVVDRNCRYLFINRNHITRMGFSENEYQGHAYGEFHSPEETKWFVTIIDKVFATGKSFKEEHKSLRDGRYFFQTLSPLKDAEGEIIAVTVVSKDINELKTMEEKFRSLSITDELTGLFNRRGFFTFADRQIKLSNRHKTGIFMLYADLDGLKMINDTFGHKEGDLALIEMANLLKVNYRDSDIIARIGGDEFVVIPVGTIEDDIEIITARFQNALVMQNEKTNRNFKLLASVGIAYYDPENPCSLDELLIQADRMMYKQKRHHLGSKYKL
jgi:diguanylate cyclase (GGDEF)-like protein/PAS domain S-box-containing protein